jgi:Flp pilus assembly protein TadG
MSERRRKRGKEKGQVLVLVTLVSIPLFAMIGLVVDLGWMRFLKKSAQAAADSAAMAAILQFQATVSGSSFTCGAAGVVCQAPTACPSAITTPANPLFQEASW